MRLWRLPMPDPIPLLINNTICRARQAMYLITVLLGELFDFGTFDAEYLIMKLSINSADRKLLAKKPIIKPLSPGNVF